MSLFSLQVFPLTATIYIQIKNISRIIFVSVHSKKAAESCLLLLSSVITVNQENLIFPTQGHPRARLPTMQPTLGWRVVRELLQHPAFPWIVTLSQFENGRLLLLKGNPFLLLMTAWVVLLICRKYISHNLAVSPWKLGPDVWLHSPASEA